jgi:hypothetical protein
MEEIHEVPFFHALVFSSPPDLAHTGWLFNNELVIGRSPDVMPGSYNNGTQVRDVPFLPPDYLFIEVRRRGVPVDAPHISKS